MSSDVLIPVNNLQHQGLAPRAHDPQTSVLALTSLRQIRTYVLNGAWEATCRGVVSGVPCCPSTAGGVPPQHQTLSTRGADAPPSR
jgi:hypothetical protein